MGKKAEATKQKILDCALDLFNEKGFDRVTVEQITQRAGVAKGSFYTYFRTKSDVIVEEFWQIDASYDKLASSRLKDLTDATAKLRAFIKAQMEYIRDEVGWRKLKVLYANQAAEPAAYQMITNTKRRWHAIVRDVIAEDQARGVYRKDLPADRLAVLVNRCLRGLFLDWCVLDGGFDLVEEGERMVEEVILPTLNGAIPRPFGQRQRPR